MPAARCPAVYRRRAHEKAGERHLRAKRVCPSGRTWWRMLVAEVGVSGMAGEVQVRVTVSERAREPDLASLP